MCYACDRKKNRKRYHRAGWLALYGMCFIIGLLLGGTCRASEPTDSYYVDSLGYASADGAATIALNLSREKSKSSGFEFCGAVFEYEGSFYYTEPVTSRDEDECAYTAYIPQGGKLAGKFHTHPRGASFSELDMRTARQLGVPTYIIAVPSGVVEKFIPNEIKRLERIVTVARL